MPFQIPSMEEARKKQENAASLSQGSRFRAAKSHSAAATASVTGSSATPTGNKGQGQKRPASNSSFVNPYAKKKPPAAGSTRNNGSKGIVGGRAPSTPGQNKQPSSRQNQSVASAAAPPQTNFPPPVDVGPFATFSQAFGHVEDTDQYQNEMRALRGAGAGKSRNDKERAEQRAFDAATAAAAEAATESPAAGRSSLGSSSSTPGSARDNHLQLQPHVLHVSTKQRGNAVLSLIRNMPFTYSKMVPDYIFSPNRCALFLSCKYHNLHPNYIHRRIAEIKTDFDLRVLLCMVDVEDNASTLLFLNKLCVVNNMTLLLAWSNEEAARYLETLKAFEGKDASSIQRREQTNFADQVADVLSTARSINKTDSAQLLSQFGSLKALMSAPMDELSLCPGIGEKKVKRLYEAFHKPFSSAASRKRREAREAKELAQSEEAGEEEDEEVVATDQKKPARETGS